MVNEEKTLENFGYKFIDLKSQSSKKIYVNCDYCGGERIITCQYLTESTKLINKYSCKKCKPLKTKEVNLLRYGKTCNLHTIEGKAKVKNTIKQKYGSDSIFQSQFFKDKSKETCKIKYDVENAFQNKEIQKKQQKTCLERYGVDNVSKNDDIKEKIIKARIASGNIKVIDGKMGAEWAKELDLAYSSFMERVHEWGFELAIKKDKNISILEQKLKEYFDYSFIKYELHKKIDDKICDFFYQILI